jgi:hypothetical protein
LLIWLSLKFIQPTFSSAHWFESEFIQLRFSSAHSVESELGFELTGWWTTWLSSNLGFELTWQPAQLRLKLIRLLRLIWLLVGLLVGWVWIGVWADNEVLLLSPN